VQSLRPQFAFWRNEVEFHRRGLLRFATAAVALPALTSGARALDYPTRPIHMMVGIPAGLAPDIVARLFGAALSERFGQPLVVENRTGSGGIIAAQAIAGAPADGYALLLVISGYASGGALYPNIAFNFVHDIAPVAYLGTSPFVMSVPASFPAKTVPEFIAYAK